MNRLNFRSPLLLMLLLVVGLVVVACGGSSTPAPTAAPTSAPSGETATAVPAAEAETVRLTLMGWSSSDAENSRLQAVVDTFNANNPNIQVTLNLVPEYDTRLQTSLAGGSPPDVFYVDSFKLPDFVRAGAIAPAEGRLTNPDDFYPSLRTAFTIDNTFYCPPKDFSTLALQYNKDLFDAAGLDYPDASWTWDDLAEAAEALTDAEAGVHGMVLGADFARWIAFLYQAGGSVTNGDFTQMTINSPEGLAAAEFYIGLATDGFAAQPTDMDSGWAGEAFGKGNAAMSMEGNWIISYLADNFPDVNYGVTELPAGPGGKGTMAFTVCYAVPAAGKNIEASFELVNYLTGPEGMKEWTDLGLAMPTRESLRAGWLEKFPDLEPFLDGAEYARPWQFRPGFQDVLDTVNDGLQQAMIGSMAPETVLQQAETVGNEVLAR